ncbi:hypothetical protein PspLS_09876 [Pyricularia sp. CBS 133598]|nr:hypothetical protein PspLS_09876 [Pyricularia sp. CBS 133598]
MRRGLHVQSKGRNEDQTLRRSSIDNKRGLREAPVATPTSLLFCDLCSPGPWFTLPKPSLHLRRRIDP